MNDNVVVASNVIQSVIETTTNIVTYTNNITEPIISAAQGPQGPQGISSTNVLSGLLDVSLDLLQEGSLLVYDSYNQVWKSTKVLGNQAIECGQY